MEHNLIDTLEQESTNVELHVDLCQRRYLQLIHKLEQMEHILNEMNETSVNNEAKIYKNWLKWAGVIIVMLSGWLAHFIIR